MKNIIIPSKLQAGDEIRVLSPSTGLKRVNSAEDNLSLEKLFNDMGYKVTYSKHIDEFDMMSSASIESRVEDLHDAFSDPKVKVILTSIGGYNSNELLPYLDYDLIQSQPKILSGYSDISALQNAIFEKTGLVTYSGPAYSSFKMLELQAYQTKNWLTALTQSGYDLLASDYYTSDEWFIPEKPRHLIEAAWKTYSPGEALGTAIVGNLNTFNLLQGTPYAPQVECPILFVESAEENNAFDFSRNLASLLQAYPNPAAVLIGRFPKESETTKEMLLFILDKHPILKTIPVLYDLDFGHTQPIFTFPIGGTVSVDASKKVIKVIEG